MGQNVKMVLSIEPLSKVPNCHPELVEG